MSARASCSAPFLGALLATLVAAACSSGSHGGSGGGERDGAADASSDGDDAASSSGGADATGTGSSSGGPLLDAPAFGPDGCALLDTPCTQGSQCCSGMCPAPQFVCVSSPSQP